MIIIIMMTTMTTCSYVRFDRHLQVSSLVDFSDFSHHDWLTSLNDESHHMSRPLALDYAPRRIGTCTLLLPSD